MNAVRPFRFACGEAGRCVVLGGDESTDVKMTEKRSSDYMGSLVVDPYKGFLH